MRVFYFSLSDNAVIKNPLYLADFFEDLSSFPFLSLMHFTQALTLPSFPGIVNHCKLACFLVQFVGL